MDTTIVAVDLGKFNSVLCWYETAARSTSFRTIRSDAAELRKELTRHSASLVVFGSP
jgi:hypothetical protein